MGDHSHFEGRQGHDGRPSVGQRRRGASELRDARSSASVPSEGVEPVAGDPLAGVRRIGELGRIHSGFPKRSRSRLGAFFRNTASNGGTTGPAHGDFAPWNLLQAKSGWALVDWEASHFGAPRTSTSSTIRTGQLGADTACEASHLGWRLKGWVGRAVGPYAAGSEIHARESKHFLREYLRISAANLNLEAPRRGARPIEAVKEADPVTVPSTVSIA